MIRVECHGVAAAAGLPAIPCGKVLRAGSSTAPVSHGLCRLCELITYERGDMLTPWERVALAVRRPLFKVGRWIVSAAKGGGSGRRAGT